MKRTPPEPIPAGALPRLGNIPARPVTEHLAVHRHVVLNDQLEIVAFDHPCSAPKSHDATFIRVSHQPVHCRGHGSAVSNVNDDPGVVHELTISASRGCDDRHLEGKRLHDGSVESLSLAGRQEGRRSTHKWSDVLDEAHESNSIGDVPAPGKGFDVGSLPAFADEDQVRLARLHRCQGLDCIGLALVPVQLSDADEQGYAGGDASLPANVLGRRQHAGAPSTTACQARCRAS